jgi:hypothetical protein
MRMTIVGRTLALKVARFAFVAATLDVGEKPLTVSARILALKVSRLAV